MSKENTPKDTALASLTLRNDLKLMPAAVTFVGRVAESCDLGYRAVQELELAVAEGVANVLRHAFKPGQEAVYQVLCFQVPGGLEVRIRDQGIPYQPEAGECRESRRGMEIMSRHLDRFSFVSLGHDGKEVRMVKLAETSTSWCEVEAPSFCKETFCKDDLVVRLMTDADAIEVARCFYDVYGYDYGTDTVYEPNRLVELNKAGLLRTFVAATPEGFVLGTESLERSDTETLIYEAGMAAVRPEARHFGVGHSMGNHVAGFLAKERVPGVWAACVTSHTFSQRTVPPGCQACAIFPGNKPADETMDEAQQQRNSVLFLYRDLNPKPPTPTLYLPKQYEDMCQRILSGFGWNPIYGELQNGELSETTEGSYDANFLRGRVAGRVTKYGKDFAQKGREQHNFFRTHGYAAIYVFLPLNHPYVGEATNLLESWGYFFNGIFPGTGHNDPFLAMGYLNNQILDYSKIQIVDEFGQELCDYIKQQDPEQKAL